MEPSHDDTFALVPHLRSLHLTLRNELTLAPLEDRANKELIDEPPVDIERMLDSLPHLTSLRCDDIYLNITDLLDIASHSSLEELYISAEGQQLADPEWIGMRIEFPISVEEDEMQLKEDAAMNLDGDIEEESDETVEIAFFDHLTSAASALLTDAEEKEPPWLGEKTRRLQSALTRMRPTRRSCETRLALADWLHRRLRRSSLYTDHHHQPAWLLRRYRKQVAQIRFTLQRQLSELTEATLASGIGAALSCEDESDSMRLKQLQQLLHQRKKQHNLAVQKLGMRKIELEDDRKLSDTQSEQSLAERSAAAVEIAGLERTTEVLRQKEIALQMRVCTLEEQIRTMQYVMGIKREAPVERIEPPVHAYYPQSLDHPTHPHPLQYAESVYDGRYTCGLCSQHKSGLVYHCKKCKYDICFACFWPQIEEVKERLADDEWKAMATLILEEEAEKQSHRTTETEGTAVPALSAVARTNVEEQQMEQPEEVMMHEDSTTTEEQTGRTYERRSLLVESDRPDKRVRMEE